MPVGDKAPNGTYRPESLSKGPALATTMPSSPPKPPNGQPPASNGAVKPPPVGAGRTTIDAPLPPKGKTLPESGLTTEHEDILDDLEENSGMTVNLASIMHARIEELLKGLTESKQSVADLTKRLNDMNKSLMDKDAQLLKLQKSDAEMKSKLEERDKQLSKHNAAYGRVKVVNERLSKTLADRKSYFETPMKAGKCNNSSLV